MSLDVNDFKGFLTEKGILNEYKEYIVRRYGSGVTIELIWKDFNNRDILNASVVWNNTQNPNKWPGYNREWNNYYDKGIKPMLSKCKSIW